MSKTVIIIKPDGVVKLMTRYMLETEDRKWINTFNSRNEALDYAKADLAAAFQFQGVPSDQWAKLAKRSILTNLTTREEDLVYYVYHNGRTVLLTKPL